MSLSGVILERPGISAWAVAGTMRDEGGTVPFADLTCALQRA